MSFSKKIFLLLALVSASFLQAQTRAAIPEYKKYDWEEEPKRDSLSAEEEKQGAVIIKDKRLVEYYFETAENIVIFSTRHMVVRVNTDAAIEQYNKVYIPMTNVLGTVNIQARTISKSGKITNLPESAIKEVPNYEDRGPYKIFALEGLEVGGQLEYLYTLKKTFTRYSSESFRSEFNYRKIEFSLFAPSHLAFEVKGYNGLPEAKEDDDNDTKFEINLNAESIKGFESEKYSNGDAAYPKILYVWRYNTSSSKSTRLHTWKNAADLFYQSIYTVTSKEKRKAQAFYKRIGVKTTMSDEEKIRRIESYVKNNIIVREEFVGDQFVKIDGIVKTRYANETGVMRLYNLLFEFAGIKREIVLTSDRFDRPFDGDFETYSYLQHFLYYFPTTGKFIAPGELFYRYGYAPADWMYQDGLFIRPVILDGYSSGIGSIKKITGPEARQNSNNLYANVRFDLDLGESKLHVKHQFTGFYALGYQPIYAYLNQEKQDELVREIAKNGAKDADPKNITVTGKGGEDTLYQHPFTVEADLTTTSFLEKAGDKYIFKIGEIIGPQAELYQKSERRTPVELYYPHTFHRELVFTVPDGYKVTNLEALKIDIFRAENDQRTLEFKSSYTQEGNTVTVIIDELYGNTYYDKSVYEDFRKVINASADFNKVTLFFEKI